VTPLNIRKLMAEFKAKMVEIKAKMVDIKSQQFDSQVKTKKFGPSEQSTPEGMDLEENSEYSENNSDFFAFNLADLDRSMSSFSSECSYKSFDSEAISQKSPCKSKEIVIAKADGNGNTPWGIPGKGDNFEPAMSRKSKALLRKPDYIHLKLSKKRFAIYARTQLKENRKKLRILESCEDCFSYNNLNFYLTDTPKRRDQARKQRPTRKRKRSKQSH
jgi:hypothetical protein